VFIFTFLFPTDAGQAEELLLDFITRLRETPWLSSALFVYLCERNTGMVAGTQALKLRYLPKVYCVSEKTSEYRKQAFAEELRDRIGAKSMAFWDEFVCVPGNGKDIRKRRVELTTELKNQLKRAQVEQIQSTLGKKPRTVGWNAKCRADGSIDPSLKDDILITMCMANYFEYRFEMKTLDFVDWKLIDSVGYNPTVLRLRTARVSRAQRMG